ncbi:FtsK/SpoIIIE domain-containing protein [Alicyclobacillus acidocaldarius]|uniref:Putative DNA translocase coupling protein n=1 Tax=Alicyclobacillus acidocaldarius (strain Tc-4-1) TaxID=1048834 RepID=F8IKE5_ALIAT|nr:FtsK/SpoIIIE domain-containing protein [Alicyclobacillus acidocaldarius]AEJ42333.1 putative DNA translocase coupling protein [Alicyclobacillus acidocaldarius subsp. acidocaldarius Tc-4-1]
MVSAKILVCHGLKALPMGLHLAHGPERWQWLAWFLGVPAVFTVYLAWTGWLDRNRVIVDAFSFEEALRRANLWDNPRYRRPTLVRVKERANGDVELIVAGLPASIWQKPEITDPFCASFGVERFRSVSQDPKRRDRVHLVLASGSLDQVVKATSRELGARRLPKPKVKRDRDDEDAHPVARMSFLLGYGHDGKVFWRLPIWPHLLIAGSTGSGKSTLIRLIMTQALEGGWLVYLVDPKGGVDYLELLPRLAEPMKEFPQDALPLLEALWATHRERLTKLKEAGVSSLREAHERGFLLEQKPSLLVVDELSIFTSSTGGKDEKDMRTRAHAYLERFALASRATGIALLLSAQYPTAEILGSQIRQQVWRICGRVDDEIASRTILGISGAEKLPPDKPGRFLYVEHGELKEFQVMF